MSFKCETMQPAWPPPRPPAGLIQGVSQVLGVGPGVPSVPPPPSLASVATSAATNAAQAAVGAVASGTPVGQGGVIDSVVSRVLGRVGSEWAWD